MCTNYRPTQRQLLRDVFGVEPPPDVDWRPETYRDYAAPIVRADAAGNRESVLATFGMVPRARIVDRAPAGAKPKNFDTMNARAETVGQKVSFSGAWKAGQLCLVPATAVYEPNYEADPAKSTRYRIWVRNEPAFGIAGLWRSWPDGSRSFTMLTLNADSHELMRRMHAPGKEKRGVVIVPREEWASWLACRDPEVARSFLRLLPAEMLETEPAPAASRGAAVGRRSTNGEAGE